MQLESGLEEGGGRGAVRRATEEREKCESGQRVVKERKQIEQRGKREKERFVLRMLLRLCFAAASTPVF